MVSGWETCSFGSKVASNQRVLVTPGVLHERLVDETREHPIVVDVPYAAPMPPGPLVQAVIERQRRYIEAEIGRALHVVMAAENIGAAAGMTDISGGEQQDAARANVCRSDCVLGLAHRPDQARGLLLGEYLGNTFDLRLGKPGDAFHLVRRPFLDFLADVLHPIDPLADEFLILPAVLENVPQHAVNRRNVGARAYPDIFGCVRCRARHPRIDDDHVGAVELLAFKDVLQRHRMRLRRIAAHDHDGLGIADVVVAVGHGAVAPGIGDAGDRSGVTNAGLMIGVVGSPERSELAVEVGSLIGEFGGAEPVDRIRPRLRPDLQQLVADLVDGLVPGDAVPRAVHKLHREAHATFAEHVVAHGRALAAVRATIDRTSPSPAPARSTRRWRPRQSPCSRRSNACRHSCVSDTVAPGGGGGPALALRTAPTDKVPSAARPPAVRPERCRKLRRSRSPVGAAGSAGSGPRRGCRCVRLMSTRTSFTSPDSG